MTDQDNPDRAQDEPPSSPFPESSLTPPPPSWQPPTAPQESGLWAEQPSAPAPQQPPPPTGLSSGDPLSGGFGQGYTTAPPPGAGGLPPIAGLGGQVSGATAGQYVLSGWWRRVGAALIDGVIISMITLLIMASIGVGYLDSDFNADADWAVLVVGVIVAFFIFAVVAMVYSCVLMGATNGKTLGRMATGIRVVRTSGERVTFGFAVLREVVVKTLGIGLISQLTFGILVLVDVLWPLWDDENRALHDFVVNTRTIRD